jgi:hypothetical protein
LAEQIKKQEPPDKEYSGLHSVQTLDDVQALQPIEHKEHALFNK